MPNDPPLAAVLSLIDRAGDARCRRFLVGVAHALTVTAREYYGGREPPEFDAEALARFNELQHQLLGYALCESWEGGRSPSQFVQDLIESCADRPAERWQVLWAVRFAAGRSLRQEGPA